MTFEDRLDRLEQIAEARAQDCVRLVEVANQQTLLIEDLQQQVSALGWLASLCIASSQVARDALQSIVDGRGLDAFPIEDDVIAHIEGLWQALRPHVDDIRAREVACLAGESPVPLE